MSTANVHQRERDFYNHFWIEKRASLVEGTLVPIPGIETLAGKRVLICSCGSGVEAVLAAKAGAEVCMFDISDTAVENTLRVAALNHVNVSAEVMSFEELRYDDNVFDVMYGSSILHHVDCARVATEIYRCLKPGGVAYFLENSARNPLVRVARRLVFGTPGKNQRQRFLFFTRHGTADEYPLTDAEVAEFDTAFSGNVQLVFDEFVFFQLLHAFCLRREWFRSLTLRLDELVVALFPGLMKYSYDRHVWMQKPKDLAGRL